MTTSVRMAVLGDNSIADYKCREVMQTKLYKMGRPRAVPYKDMGSDYDTGWLDDICTERRGDDE